MIIETFDLTKEYGSGKGCRRINLAVEEGRIFGFLGPNGAGKSTLVKMLMGLLRPTGGKALLLGRPLGDLSVRADIGFLPENFYYHPWLTAREVLKLHASLYRLDKSLQPLRIAEVLKWVRLTGSENQKVGQFSKGMQQRLGIAAALLAKPKLVFLDEPTSALDPIGRREVREILVRLRNEGTTVFLNSHLLSEVEMVCDQVAFIKNGRMLATGGLEDLLQTRLEVELKIGRLGPELRLALEAIGELEAQDQNHFILRLNHENQLPQVAKTVIDGGGELYQLIPRRRTLEELFVQLMQEESEV